MSNKPNTEQPVMREEANIFASSHVTIKTKDQKGNVKVVLKKRG